MAQIRGFCIFFLFGRAGAAAETTITHATKCRRAVGLSVPMAGMPAISTSIPHACSSDTTPVSRRTSCFLVSTFSRAAIFPHAPSIPGVAALVPRALTPGYRGLQPYRAA